MVWWFAQNAVMAAVLAGLVWGVCRFRSIAPAVRHALWLVVLIKLATPPIVQWPAPPSLNWLQSAASDNRANLRSINADAAPENVWLLMPDEPIRAATPETLPFLASKLEPTDPTFETSIEGELNPPLAVQTDARIKFGIDQVRALTDSCRAFASSRWIWLLGVVWLAGAVVTGGVQAVRIVRFARLIRRCESAPPSLVRRVRQIGDRMGVRAPRVVVAGALRSPVIWGGFRAELVWPATLPRDFESGRWDGVIAHELAHLRRRDHWVGWLELFTGCIWWWNPLVWYVRHQLRENAELSCDALVVWALPDGRRTYAESLIEVVSHLSELPTPVPVLGASSVARQAFERRLTMILSERVSWKLPLGWLVAVLGVALITLPGWSLGQEAPEPPQEAVLVAEPDATALTPGSGEVTVKVPSLELAYELELNNEPQDDRIKGLEQKLDALVAEVKALRSTPKPKATAGPVLSFTGRQVPGIPRSQNLVVGRSENWNVQMLSRATYMLPKAKAEALAAFLREHMKSPIEAEVKSSSENASPDNENPLLIVTAAPDVQSIVAQFIALSEGRIVRTTPSVQPATLGGAPALWQSGTPATVAPTIAPDTPKR